MKQYLPPAAAALMLAACATVEPPVPASYSGPTAKVDDSSDRVTSRQGDFCVLQTLDGRRIANSIGETLQRGAGKGLTLYAWVTKRQVPARPVKAGLKCETVHAAPILALMGTVYSVEGTVDFDPQPDRRYVVKGVLGADESSVWIEDAQTGAAVTAKVSTAKPQR